MQPTRCQTAVVLYCVLVGSGCSKTTNGSDDSPEFLYVSNEQSDDVSVIDTAGDVEVARIAVGKRPRGLKVSHDGRTLYVAVSGSPRAGPNAARDTALPADRMADGIAVVDLTQRRVVRVLAAGQDPEAFDLSLDETRAFVSNEETAEVTVVDTRDGHIVAVLKVGDEPEGVTTRPDGAVVYVTSEDDDEVAVIDAHAHRVLTRVKAGTRPRSVVFTRDGSRAFVSNEGSASITVIDARQHAVLATIALGDDTAKPMGLVLSADERELFVSTGRGGSVAVVDTATHAMTRQLRGIGVRPWGIARTRGGKLYTANGPSGDVSVLQTETGIITKKIRVGASPWGLAVGPGSRMQTASLAPIQPEKKPASMASDGDWPMATKDYSLQRYSTLADIDRENVAKLQLAWTFSTGIPKGHEAAPLVIGGTMYFTTPYPNRLIALDLTKPGAPMKWIYEPKPSAAAQGVACCDVVNRGATHADGRLFFNTLDAHTVAVDAATGRELWKTKIGEIHRGETMTMAPQVVKGKVLVGNSGGELGVRGNLTALDAATGKIAWRAYSTGPDADVLIGERFKPFYASDKGKDLGVSSWPAEHWQIGGGTVWGFISYDPELDLIYYGAANPGPWNPAQRPGDNKWTNGIFARDPDDGQAVWFYQLSPHDLYDHDGVNENMLVDLDIDGKRRKTIVHTDRNGFLYVIDRQNGQVLSADPFAHNTIYTSVDLKSGRIGHHHEMEVGFGKTVRGACPAAPGAKDWQATAYSPRTGILYIPHNNLCQDTAGIEANYIAGTPYLGVDNRMYAGPGGNAGVFSAWDLAGHKELWSIEDEFPVWGGALVTAGDIVFYGTMTGWFRALDATTGKQLWEFKTGSGIVAPPVTYRGPDGKQYIAIFSGVGGWPGGVVVSRLDTRDESGALGFSNAMRNLPGKTQPGGTLYTFVLP